MKTKKKKIFFNLSEEYRQSWGYIKESRKFIYFVMGIFLLFVLIGLFIPVPASIYDKIMDFIKEILEKTQDMSQLELIAFIILNNIQSTFFGIFFGSFFGIFPIISTIANGYILGFVSLLSINDGGIFSLWRIFPHGIFELPAVFISLGLGLKLGMFIFQKNKLESFRIYLINSLRAFLFVIVPLLIIAGIIEGTFMVLIG